MTRSLELEVLVEEFAVAQLPAQTPVPSWAQASTGMTAITRTDEELSIVAAESLVPEGVARVGPWRALKVRGPLSFEITGILAALATPLAQAGVSIFAVSTYDTDYILVRAKSLARAVEALRRAGHRVDQPA